MNGETQEKTRFDRANAWGLLCEYTQSESLRKHALAVEACMRAYAGKFAEDQEKWGLVGLIHDFDYEKYPTPDQHVWRGAEILQQRGWPEEIRHRKSSVTVLLTRPFPSSRTTTNGQPSARLLAAGRAGNSAACNRDEDSCLGRRSPACVHLRVAYLT